MDRRNDVWGGGHCRLCALLSIAICVGTGSLAGGKARPAPRSRLGSDAAQATRRAEPSSPGRPIRLTSGNEPVDRAAIEDPAAGRSTPIDLPSALRLAGIENLELMIARQRVEAAVAVQQLAAAQILPTLNLGTNYNLHTGNLQQASGNILNVQRSALYVGAGAGAVAAGTVSIPGLQWNLNLSDSIYSYFVTQQRTAQSQFDNQSAEN